VFEEMAGLLCENDSAALIGPEKETAASVEFLRYRSSEGKRLTARRIRDFAAESACGQGKAHCKFIAARIAHLAARPKSHRVCEVRGKISAAERHETIRNV
jgi:hypothetical protein